MGHAACSIPLAAESESIILEGTKVDGYMFYEGSVYIDGSSDSRWGRQIVRGSFAAVQVDRAGRVTRSVTGVVPRGTSGTPQAAEYYALKAVARNCSPEVRIVGDCANVLRDALAAESVGRDPRRPYAGVVREAFSRAAARRPLANVQKVAAHQDLADPRLSGAAREDAVGNDRADMRAKAAMARHPQPLQETVSRIDAVWQDAVAVARHVGRASALWPAARRSGRASRRPGAPRGRRSAGARAAARNEAREAARCARASHCWAHWKGAARCSRCLVLHSRSAARRVCPGRAAAWEDVLSGAPRAGHRLWVADAEAHGGDAVPMAMCARCGAFSLGNRLTQLLQPCAAPGRSGRYALDRVRRGLFPVASKAYRGLVVTALTPLYEEAAEDFADVGRLEAGAGGGPGPDAADE